MTLQDLPDVAKAGWLVKQGGLVRGFKKRYFVLQQGLLYYFKSDQSTSPQGTVLLESVQVRAASKAEAGRHHAIAIQTPAGRTYMLAATSAEECSMWVVALEAQSYLPGLAGEDGNS
uniref:PH domain-containing protein n=1 Tax=Haptolina brevifila TaxID=156173 RepID=A0A7S2FKY6_9EUKA|mmetsp:Transcript_13287/g.26713  ORF Transcript_13287/g.26713 Transcript_13287/m.26713 type:complete len:117 (+) Transcript_13287:98-448(+)